MKTSKYLLTVTVGALFVGNIDTIEAMKRPFPPIPCACDIVKDRAQLSLYDKNRFITESECAYLRELYLKGGYNEAEISTIRDCITFALENLSLRIAHDYHRQSDWNMIATRGNNSNRIVAVTLLEKAPKDMTLPLPLKTCQDLYKQTQNTGDLFYRASEKKKLEVLKSRAAIAEDYLNRFFWGEEEVTEDQRKDIEDLIKCREKYSDGAITAQNAKRRIEAEIGVIGLEEIAAIRAALDERERQLRKKK